MDFSQIALLFVFASVFGIIAKVLKQPLFIGYLLAGVLLSSIGAIGNLQFMESFGHIGVSLLLFLMGLEMSLKDVSSVGKASFIAGAVQITLSFVIGFIISLVSGFDFLPSFYVAIAMTFSSTIISVRLLAEKLDLVSLYGRISIAILLLQDLVAVIVLMFITSFSRGETDLITLIPTFLKGFALIFIVWYLSKKTLPIFFEKLIGGSQELLFIISISWALGVSALIARYSVFTLEVGGFLAGLSLSGLPEHLQIASKARPLRDFFLIIFFLSLGTGVVTGNFFQVIIPALVLSAIVIITHVVSVMIGMGGQGFKKRTSFMTGLTISQISEFSLIIASVGLAVGHIDKFYSSLITTIGIITMITSTYLVSNSEKIYSKIKNTLTIFEKKRTKEHIFLPESKMDSHIVVVGSDKTGTQLVDYFVRMEAKFLVVDFNPKVFTKLTAKNTPVVFGDINDTEILDAANIKDAKMVILTTSNLTDNVNFLSYLKGLAHKPVTIFTSSSKSDAIKLYESGADYVIVPDVVAGDYIKHLLKTYGKSGDRLKVIGQNHFKRLMFI